MLDSIKKQLVHPLTQLEFLAIVVPAVLVDKMWLLGYAVGWAFAVLVLIPLLDRYYARS